MCLATGDEEQNLTGRPDQVDHGPPRPATTLPCPGAVIVTCAGVRRSARRAGVRSPAHNAAPKSGAELAWLPSRLGPADVLVVDEVLVAVDRLVHQYGPPWPPPHRREQLRPWPGSNLRLNPLWCARLDREARYRRPRRPGWRERSGAQRDRGLSIPRRAWAHPDRAPPSGRPAPARSIGAKSVTGGCYLHSVGIRPRRGRLPRARHSMRRVRTVGDSGRNIRGNRPDHLGKHVARNRRHEQARLGRASS